LNMTYHRFNIGRPTNQIDLDAWWAENVRRGVITAGFDGTPGDAGERHLLAMREGDWILAYVSGHGYVGAGRVLGANTYSLHKRVPKGSLSNHLHERGIRWEYVVLDIEHAIPEGQANLYHPVSTRVPVANDSEAAHLMRLLKELTQSYLQVEPNYSPALDQPLSDFESMLSEFEQAVQLAGSDSSAARKARLKNAPKLPKRVKVTADVFVRNPDVVAEVLYQANGVCGRCHKAAPFARRSDGTPYLEVHHLNQLAKGGEDIVENAIALCPNCHREMHYGV
jgi:hypothetical protein